MKWLGNAILLVLAWALLALTVWSVVMLVRAVIRLIGVS